MDSEVAIEIVPVVEGNNRYYKTIVLDLECDNSGTPSRVVRDIYHSDSLHIAIETLHQFLLDGAFRR